MPGERSTRRSSSRKRGIWSEPAEGSFPEPNLSLSGTWWHNLQFSRNNRSIEEAEWKSICLSR